MYRSLFERFIKEEDGDANVEYSLIVALVSVVQVVAWKQLAGTLNTKMNAIATAFSPSQ